MDAEIIRVLKSLDLFMGTPEHLIHRIANQTKIVELAKGEVLVKQGDSSDSLFLIRRGWVKIVTSGKSGEEVVLNQCGPGQIIGEMSLLDQQPRSSGIVALSTVNLLEIKYNAILDNLNEHPALAVSLLRDMSARLRFANAYIEEAVEWCQQIAAGNYEFVEQQVEQTRSTIIDLSKTHEARASAFLSSFFKMVKDIRYREEDLKRQVRELTIQIDEARREQIVKEVTETSFFTDLQAVAKKLRGKRSDQIEKPPEQDQPNK